MKTGIQVALTGESIDSDALAYDSQMGHLLVDNRPGADKLILLDNLDGGTTAWTSTVSVMDFSEILWSKKHNLDFIPRVQASFYVRDAPASIAHRIGTYNGLFSNSGGAITETLMIHADEENVYIKRRFQAVIDGFTSVTQDCLFNVKILIFNNPAGDSAYENSFEYI